MPNRKFFLSAVMILTVLAAMLVLAPLASAQTADVTAPVVTAVVPADGATIYTNGATTVTKITADYADEAGGSGIDPSTVMVHLDGGNMLFDCPIQTESHVECNATVTDLFAGAHTLDIYVADMAGNLTVNRTNLTVVIDNQPPVYTNLSPVDGSTILTSTLGSLAMQFDYSDPDPSGGAVMPMIHVNDLHDGTSGAMIMGCTKTTTHYSCAAIKAKRLHLGSNWMEVLLKDKMGNDNYSLPSRMNYYTVVDDIAPVITGVTADSAAISANFNDPEPAGRLAGSATLASGIDVASATVSIDGVAIPSGCTVTATDVTCTTPAGLSGGDHAVTIVVADSAGNSATASGTLSLPVVCSGKPSLSLGSPSAFWGSYSDYTAKQLSVDWTVTNTGADTAFGVSLTTSNSTYTPITTVTAMPVTLGDLGAGASVSTTVKYQLPAGYTAGGFRVINTASASDNCATQYVYP